jgi:hypothetical protein
MAEKPKPRNPALFGPFPRVGSLRMAARLLLGAALTGSDELNRRFGTAQQVYRPAPAERDLLLASETDADHRRYAVLGALAETTQAAQKGVSSAGSRVDRAYRAVARAARPVTSSRLAQPVNRRIDRYVARGDTIVRRWVEAGRAEEQLSRELASQATVQTIETTLDYLARSPEMDQLTKEQSLDLVDQMMDDVQEGAIGGRIFLVRWFSGIIRRRPDTKDTQVKVFEIGATQETPPEE